MGLRNFFRNVASLGKTDIAENEQRFHQFLQSYNLNLQGYGIPLDNGINNLSTYTHGIDYLGPYHHHSALQLATVYTCVLVRGEALSTLPCSVLQSTPKGSIVAYKNPAYDLVHSKPNPFQTAADFWKMVSAQMDLYGNSYALITHSGRMQPERLDLVEKPEEVTIHKTRDRKKIFEYNGKTYADWQILHFKDLSLDGYYGISRVKYNAATIGYATNLKRFGNNAIGVKPPGYFSTDANFDVVKKQEENLQKGWSDAIAIGKTPLLPFGLKYNNLQISPSDAQYLDAIGATKEDICAIFRVPPTLVQDYDRATFANAEQQDLVFIKYTMLPIITNLEQECNSKLFAEGNMDSAQPYYVKFNVNAFMRGDFKSRTEGYRILYQSGLITGNMVADWEDWNHYEGGETRYIPMNMIPIDKVDEFVNKLTTPVNTNTGDPGGSDNERSEVLNGIIFKKKVNGHAN